MRSLKPGGQLKSVQPDQEPPSASGWSSQHLATLHSLVIYGNTGLQDKSEFLLGISEDSNCFTLYYYLFIYYYFLSFFFFFKDWVSTFSYALLGKTGYINWFVIIPGLLSQYGPRGVHFGSKKGYSVRLLCL